MNTSPASLYTAASITRGVADTKILDKTRDMRLGSNVPVCTTRIVEVSKKIETRTTWVSGSCIIYYKRQYRSACAKDKPKVESKPTRYPTEQILIYRVSERLIRLLCEAEKHG